MHRPIRERAHRLPEHFYRGRVAVVFTACVAERRAVLANDGVFQVMSSLLHEAGSEFQCAIPVFTLMPDHIHVLAVGTEESSDTRAMMNRFKVKSGWWMYRNLSEARWQRNYWDHIVRDFEGWRSQARYIALNPCRAGLAEDIFAWPYTGSVDYDIRELLSDAFWDR